MHFDGAAEEGAARYRVAGKRWIRRGVCRNRDGSGTGRDLTVIVFCLQREVRADRTRDARTRIGDVEGGADRIAGVGHHLVGLPEPLGAQLDDRYVVGRAQLDRERRLLAHRAGRANCRNRGRAVDARRERLREWGAFVAGLVANRDDVADHGARIGRGLVEAQLAVGEERRHDLAVARQERVFDAALRVRHVDGDAEWMQRDRLAIRHLADDLEHRHRRRCCVHAARQRDDCGILTIAQLVDGDGLEPVAAAGRDVGAQAVDRAKMAAEYRARLDTAGGALVELDLFDRMVGSADRRQQVDRTCRPASGRCERHRQRVVGRDRVAAQLDLTRRAARHAAPNVFDVGRDRERLTIREPARCCHDGVERRSRDAGHDLTVDAVPNRVHAARVG